MPGGEVWETRSRRRLTKAWLGHIAMVPDPAYETANVLAVRSQAAHNAPQGGSWRRRTSTGSVRSSWRTGILS